MSTTARPPETAEDPAPGERRHHCPGVAAVQRVHGAADFRAEPLGRHAHRLARGPGRAPAARADLGAAHAGGVCPGGPLQPPRAPPPAAAPAGPRGGQLRPHACLPLGVRRRDARQRGHAGRAFLSPPSWPTPTTGCPFTGCCSASPTPCSTASGTAKAGCGPPSSKPSWCRPSCRP